MLTLSSFLAGCVRQKTGYVGYDGVRTWDDRAPTGDVTEIRGANSVVDTLVGKLVEEPTQKLLDLASRLKRKLGKGRGSLK